MCTTCCARAWREGAPVTIAPMPFESTRGPRRPIPSRRLRRPVAQITRGWMRRRWLVGLSKRLLPILALALLASIALWPEIARDTDRSRLSYRRGIAVPESGQHARRDLSRRRRQRPPVHPDRRNRAPGRPGPHQPDRAEGRRDAGIRQLADGAVASRRLPAARGQPRPVGRRASLSRRRHHAGHLGRHARPQAGRRRRRRDGAFRGAVRHAGRAGLRHHRPRRGHPVQRPRPARAEQRAGPSGPRTPPGGAEAPPPRPPLALPR